MGYTHYWTLPEKVSDEEWRAFRDRVEEIVDHAALSGIHLAWEYDDPDHKPELTDELIRFNGAEQEGHETFVIDRARKRDFCKTARKPYDTPVVACLIEASRLLDGFYWMSDGDRQEGDFDEAQEFLEDM